ncbi:hypothetical protein [Saccharicrinis sp. GN24d3]|uniref:hypothetical protein n=1 Tax=Saccharicrinis sp. GN24d3 TaxID=3458416 RepID=UPI0040351C92
MKNLFKFNLLVVAISTLFFTSCEDDKETTTIDIAKTLEEALEAEYSTEDPEESKQNIEDEAVQLVNSIKQLEQEEAIDMMMELSTMMESLGESSEPAAANSILNLPMRTASIIADEDKSTADVYTALKSATAETFNLSDKYEELKGTYVYNFDTKEFDEPTVNSEAIVFQFPGKEGDPTNTAELKISGLEVKTIAEPREDLEINGALEVPTALTSSLKYNNKEVMTYTLAASYMDDATPTSLSNIITIGDFSFTQVLNHSQYAEASFDFSLKNGDSILLAFGAEAAGDWSEENIDANTYEESETYTWWGYEYNASTGQYEQVEHSETDTWNETYMEEIINQGNAYVQLMNLKAVGKVNIKALVDGEQEFEEEHEADRDEYGDYPDEIKEAEADNLVELANQHVQLVLTYADKNTLIAALEAYKVQETETYSYDGTTYTNTDYYLDFRMVFQDNSKVSMETFVEDELSSFFEALNDFIKTMNTNYDAGFEEIDPSESDDEQSTAA